MAEWLGHSNQKLYQARLLLDQLDQFTQSDNSQSGAQNSALSSALEEAVIFQLMLAYQSYLHEVAEIAQCRDEFFSLTELLSLVPVSTGEMTELKQLEEDDFSWLTQMQSAFQQCSQKDIAAIKKPAGSAAMIQLHNQVSASLPLREWFEALSGIIDLQRNNRQES